MKRVIGLCLVVALVLSLAVVVAVARQAKDQLVRYSGEIVLVSKDKTSFTVLKNNQRIPIYYDANTKFTTRNKPGATADDLKEGRRVICMVDDSQKDKRIARRVDFRTDK